MAATNKQNRAGPHLLLDLPPEVRFMIFDLLNGGKRRVHVYQPKKADLCCISCARSVTNMGTYHQWKKPWSPWALTQVSKAHHDRWRPYYFQRTEHSICTRQFSDYLATFFGREGHRESGGRKGPPVFSAAISNHGIFIDSCSLHLILEAFSLFPKFTWMFDDGRVDEFFRKLVNSYDKGFLRGLLPSGGGAGKIQELILDRRFKLWVHPAPGYLSSFPALDFDLRESLYELWNSVPVRSIYLEILPYEGGRACSYQCDVGHRFWNKPPHRSSIQSVRRCPGAFIIQPYAFVLPEEYSLMNIGVNEQQLRDVTGAAVFVQLVAPEDDEFHIRIEGPDEYPHEYVDEDWNEITATEASVGSDDYDDDDGMMSAILSNSEDGDEDTACRLKEDMDVPLQDLLKDVYGNFDTLS